MKTTLVIILSFLLMSFKAHPIKSTFSIFEQEKNGDWFYTIRFFKDDFNASFKTIQKDFNAYDGFSEEEKTTVLNYLKTHFSLYIEQETITLKTIQKITTEAITVTFKIKTSAPKPFKSYTVYNTIFTEFFNDQTNIFRLYNGHDNYTLYLAKDYTKVSYTFPN